MSKTNKGLVEYAKAMLGKPYWYGTYGNTATKALLAAKRKQYPYYYDQSRYKVKFVDQIGERVQDCVGLIKGYLWSETPTSPPKYNAAQDVSANGMRGVCKEHGKIETIPEQVGVLVFFDGHVGVYIGGGYVIEARGHDYGVVKTRLKDRPWTSWGKCPWIDYGTAHVPTQAEKPTAQAGKTYFKRYMGNSVSIVDALDAIGQPSSYNYRKQISKANAISAYAGLPWQNKRMLDLLKSGDLIKP